MSSRTAIIVIDSGFSHKSLQSAGQVLGFCDLDKNMRRAGSPFLTQQEVDVFAGDPLDHGSIVLQRVCELSPAMPLVLIKAFRNNGDLIRTGWKGGKQVAAGWTEALLWAVDLCQQQGLSSVTNCSFGGFTHAMDGSGWEAVQLGRVTGPGVPGHVIVAAAGPGDGRAAHASWLLLPGEQVFVAASQHQSTSYNLWTDTDYGDGWAIEVKRNGQLVHSISGALIVKDWWNSRQQWTFDVEGTGYVEIRCLRYGTKSGARSAEARFDCWISSDGTASFNNYIDGELICEPAVFPHVLSVGLRTGKYAPGQYHIGGRPDILLEGKGMISFRLPEVTVTVARLLEQNPQADVRTARSFIGKYPGASLVPPSI